MKEIAHRFALLLGMGTAMVVAVITLIRGVSPLQQSFRAVVCGLAVYGIVRLALVVIGNMVLTQLILKQEEEKKKDKELREKAEAAAMVQEEKSVVLPPAA